MLLIVAGFEPLACYGAQLHQVLRRLDHEGVLLGGIDTGAMVLAEAGLLDGHRATVHWEALEAFKERYPRLQATQELFEIDRRRITCAGGTASIDLMLDLIAQTHGSELAVQVSEQFVLGRIRPRQDHQRMQIASRYGINNKLVRVIGEMGATPSSRSIPDPGRCRADHPASAGATVPPAPGRHAQWFLFATAPGQGQAAVTPDRHERAGGEHRLWIRVGVVFHPLLSGAVRAMSAGGSVGQGYLISGL